MKYQKTLGNFPFFIFLALMTLTACKDTSELNSDHPDRNIQQEAIQIIIDYANGAAAIPRVEDYQNAGVQGVTVENINKVNIITSIRSSTEVDTPEEIQNIISSLINTVPDINNSTITLLGDSLISLLIGDEYNDPGAIASDGEGNDITNEIVIYGGVNSDKLGRYYIVYQIFDASGHEVFSIIRKIIVSESPVGPVDPKNHAPTASDVTIAGVPERGEILTLKYTFEDIDNDLEGNSLIVWKTPSLELQRGNSNKFLVPTDYDGGVISAEVYPIDELGLKGEAFMANNSGIIIVDDMTINHAPIAKNVKINGVKRIGETLTVDYTFEDSDNDLEGSSLVVWKTSTGVLQSGNSKTLFIPTDYKGDKISVWVYPVDETDLKGEVFSASNNGVIIDISPKFGARSVSTTPLDKGTLFASPHGSGNACTVEIPCTLQTANKKLKSGDVLFLRGGVYDDFSYTDGSNVNDFFKFHIGTNQGGSKEKPTIIESYPGEWAIIDGGILEDLETAGRANDSYGLLRAWYTSYVYFRRLEIKNAPGAGVHLVGDNNRAEGIISHHNRGTGISLYRGSYIRVVDSIFHHNSDTIAHVGLQSADKNGIRFPYNDGDHADGIGAGGTSHVFIAHNTVYNNSDDGIDTFTQSNGYTFAEVSYNLVYQHGAGSHGGGQGIKLGKGGSNYAHHNLLFKNKNDAMVDNGGHHNIWKYNTAWKNGRAIQTALDATLIGNLLVDNITPGWANGKQIKNSWQVTGQAQLSSIELDAPNFLKPISGLGFDLIGGYANDVVSNIENPVPLFIIGDSTVNNQTTVNGQRVEMGWGNAIDSIMVDPNLKNNHARSGASSLSIQDVPTYISNDFWGNGKPAGIFDNEGALQNILETDTTGGGFLMMQFGHNDVAIGNQIDIDRNTFPEKNILALSNPPVGLTSFESNLRKYIDIALMRNITPVLITPVSIMQPWRSYCQEVNGLPACGTTHVYNIKSDGNPFKGQTLDYPQAMKDLQQGYQEKGKNVILLDLTRASMEHYRSIIVPGETKATTASVMGRYAYDDSTHFNVTGANMVAGLIKELACDVTNGDAGLCSQFK